MKTYSFFFKLFLGNLLLVGLILALAAALSFHHLNRQFQRQTEAQLQQQLGILQNYLEVLWPSSPEAIQRHCQQLARESHWRLTVVAADGQVLGDSAFDPLKMANHRTATRPEIIAALEGRPGKDQRRSDTLDIEYVYLARPVWIQGNIVGVVRLAQPAASVMEGQEFIGHTLRLAALTAVLAGILLALLLSWLWYRPLRRITATAHQLAQGNLAARAPVSGSSELAVLGQALNNMRDSLNHQWEQLRVQQQDLQLVVANLREGIVALDHEDHVVFINQAAMDLLVTDPTSILQNQHLQSVVRYSEIVDLYYHAAGQSGSLQKVMEIEVHGRRCHLEVYAVRLASSVSGGIAGLLVIRDITDLARATAMKAEFVANASHELRTPLATIRAAVDSLRDVTPEDQDTFFKLTDILDRHATRLEDMTKDLLDLHTVENGKKKPTRKPLALNEVLTALHDQFTSRARSKNITLQIPLIDPPLQLTTDRKLLDLILQNLLDNALKFTPTGGQVSCLAELKTSGVLFRVSDTGCGIRPEDQPRVFERFFQADTSRTGDPKIRGTGLGLAIVKHAAERLGVQLDLQSAPGQGTTFTVLLPDRT